MGVSLNDLDAKLCELEDSGSSSSSESSSPSPRKRQLTSKQEEILKKKRRLNQSTLCFKYLTGDCKFSDCIFRHVKNLDSSDRAEFLRELKVKPFDPKIAEYAKNQNIPLCKDFIKSTCRHRMCQFWHLEDARIARWAGFDFFCVACRKGFTSQAQLDEHRLGKAHKLKTSQ